MAFLKRLLRALPLLLISPFLVIFSAIALLLTDLFNTVVRNRPRRKRTSPRKAGTVCTHDSACATDSVRQIARRDPQLERQRSYSRNICRRLVQKLSPATLPTKSSSSITGPTDGSARISSAQPSPR